MRLLISKKTFLNRPALEKIRATQCRDKSIERKRLRKVEILLPQKLEFEFART